jgi:hypothetical protein
MRQPLSSDHLAKYHAKNKNQTKPKKKHKQPTDNEQIINGLPFSCHSNTTMPPRPRRYKATRKPVSVGSAAAHQVQMYASMLSSSVFHAFFTTTFSCNAIS